MSKFAYGIAFNMTLLKNMNPAEKSFLNISKIERDALLNKEYVLQQTDDIPADAIAYHDWDAYRKPYKEIIKHRPVLQNETLEANIGYAGHEMIHGAHRKNHAENKSWTDFIVKDTAGGIMLKPTLKKNAGLLIGEAYMLSLSYFGDLSKAYLVGFPLAVIGAKKAVSNALDYREEVSAYTYQAKLGSLLMHPSARPKIDVVEAALKNKKEAEPKLKTIKEIFIDGYPGAEKQNIIQVEQQWNFLKNTTSLFTPQRVQQLHDATQKGLSNAAFPIRIL